MNEAKPVDMLTMKRTQNFEKLMKRAKTNSAIPKKITGDKLHNKAK
jgi:hypothetical protein